MKRLIVTLIAVLIITGIPLASVGDVYGASQPPEIVGEAGYVIDAKTGVVLYSKNADSQLEPASTTKMITCLLALENLSLDTVVTIDEETPFTEGSRIYLEPGEQITVENLLYALMLDSANDSAVALGKEMAGTVENFAVMMNKRAKKLGATNTNFLNPNGLHEDGHVTTAHDLAMIAREAMTNETFRKIVSTYKYTIPASNKKEERYLYNTNRLIYDSVTKVVANGVSRPAKYDGALGIKTGYTSKAGGCLVAGANRDGTELIAVVMKSTEEGRFGDSIALLDYGFENYYSHQAVSTDGDLGTIAVKMGREKETPIRAASDYFVTLPKEASSTVITTKAVLEKKLKAPVKKGQKVGTIQILEGGEKIGTVDVVAAAAVDSGTLLSILGITDKSARIIYVIVCAIVVIMLNVFIFSLYVKKKQRWRRKALREKRAMEIALERKKKIAEYEQRGWPY